LTVENFSSQLESAIGRHSQFTGKKKNGIEKARKVIMPENDNNLQTLLSQVSDEASSENLSRLQQIIRLLMSSDPNQAIRYAHTYHDLAKKSKDPGHIAFSCYSLGAGYKIICDHKSALPWLKKALSHYTELGDDTKVLQTQGNLAGILAESGKVQQAHKIYLKNLQFYTKMKDRQNMGTTFMNLAWVSNLLGHPDKAIVFYKKAISNLTMVGNKPQIAEAYVKLGNTYHSVLRYDLSLKVYIKAVKIAESTGNEYLIAQCNNSLGSCYTTLKHYEEAIAYLEKSLATFRKYNVAYAIGTTHFDISECYLAQKKYDQALHHALQALENDSVTAVPSFLSYDSNVLGLIKHAQGEYLEAIDYYRKSIAYAEQCGDFRQLVVVSVNLVKSLTETAEFTAALDIVGNLLAKPETRQNTFALRNLYEANADLLARLGRHAEAFDSLKQHMEISREAFTAERSKEIELLKLSYDMEQKEFKSALLKQQNMKLNREVKKQSEIIRQNERQLFAQDKFATIGKMYANFAHEIKTPFQLLSNGLSEFEQVISVVEDNLYIRRNKDELHNKINRSKWIIDYISSSVRDTDVFYEKPVDLNMVVSDYVNYLSAPVRQSGFVLVAELAENLPPILGDWGRLTQIISNLVKNAAEAMQGANSKNNKIRIRTACTAKTVHLEIEDSGKGIPPAELNEVFRQFYTTKPQGLGLGLFNVKKFVNQMNGDLEIRDNGKKPGTTFRLSFRIHKSAV
jgi:signal transduction histidine kinase